MKVLTLLCTASMDQVLTVIPVVLIVTFGRDAIPKLWKQVLGEMHSFLDLDSTVGRLLVATIIKIA